MGRYITTKADFTLRRKHKKGPSGATIYENDYTTINPMPNALKGEYVIGDSNFVFTSRLGINSQKKHVRGKFIPNPSGSTNDGGAWTMDTMIDSGVTNETKIRLKPDYTSIKDFACYGSAVKLIQGTINGVITDFPAEMYLSTEQIILYKPDDGQTGYSFNEENPFAFSGNVLYNEYAIDITTANIRPETVYNPLRYFSLCGSSYNYIDASGNTYDFSGFTVTSSMASGSCFHGKSVWIDHLAKVEMVFANNKQITIDIFKDNQDETVYYAYTGVPGGGHIRPKKIVAEKFFRDCDDFTAVLLERTAKPIYTATFETPKETETGYVYDMVSYTWPSLLGGYNPDLSGPYFSYVEGLMDVAEFYDEYSTDNMWRSLTHEAIKTLDWTYVSNSDGDIQDMSAIDTSRIEPITKIYGRQFDDLKRYADGIKSINTITYNQKSNTPDYTLTDVLENSGWETKTLKITNDNDVCTESLYSGLTSGYTSSDANNEFLRRLKLNSQYLFSAKGTRKGLDSMFGMLGFAPEDYDVHEYVYVFSGGTFPHFCSATSGNDYVAYPLAKDISTINKYKVNFNPFDPYGDYCGIPVTEVGYTIENTDDPDNPIEIDCSYVIPWFSHGKNYDDGLYFQKHGGWGKRKEMDIELEIASGVSSITSCGGAVPLYTETQARLKFAKDFDELLQQAYGASNIHDVSYVTDISRIEDMYTPGFSAETDDASHYFVLENEDLNQFLGWSNDAREYGWRSIPTEEIQTPSAYTAGTLVLYLESIKDDTTGNNPHIGNGTYDDGMAYISGMSEIFAYSLINKNFIGITDSACSEIANFKFDARKYEDNRKCWFFTDDYNKKTGKESDTEIEFREVDITDKVCDLHNCNDSRINVGATCNSGLSYDIVELLSGASRNQTVIIGASAQTHFMPGTSNLYDRTSELITFDPEKRRPNGENGEAQANSVVNVKNLDVIFKIPGEFKDNDKTAFKQYVEVSVIPYLTQMIPSTSIISWSFSGDTSGVTPTPPDQPVVPSAETYTYELCLDPNPNMKIEFPSAGTSCFTVYYITKNSNNEIVSSVDVTSLSTWVSNDPSIVTFSDDENVRCVNARNEDIENEANTTIIVSYKYGEALPLTIDVTVEKADKPTLRLTAPQSIAATATTLPYSAECVTDVVVKHGGQTNYAKIGVFEIPVNTTTGSVEYKITASAQGYPSVSASTTVVQHAAAVPTIELSVDPTEISADGGSVSYTVTVAPISTPIKVQCGTEISSAPFGSFSFGKNENNSQKEYIISAWCENYPSISGSATVIQSAVQKPKIIDFSVNPTGISADGGSIAYIVTVDPVTTPVTVQWNGISLPGTGGTFIIPKNNHSENIIHTLSAWCTDFIDIIETAEVIQTAAVPTIELSVDPMTVPSVGGHIDYTVTVNPSSTPIKVQCDNMPQQTETTGTFTIGANTEGEIITHVISAWCENYPSVYASTSVTQDWTVRILTAITLDATWVEDISWSGGTATEKNCSYSVIAYYNDGLTGNVTTSAVVSGRSGYIPPTAIEERHSAGTLTLTAEYGGYSATTSVTIYQEEKGILIPKFYSVKLRHFDNPGTPLTFDIKSAGNIVWAGSPTTIQYKINDGEWSSITSTQDGVSIPVENGTTVQFMGNNNSYNGSNFGKSTCQFNVEGNIMSLIDSTYYSILNTLTEDSTFKGLFQDCTGLIKASGLLLPATKLTESCYQNMFKGCTSLTGVPILPAAILADSCYASMFDGCAKLVIAPALPATTLAHSCYASMFKGCSWLSTVPQQLSSTILADSCYYGMFSGCTSLTSAPELPATTLADRCYEGMFSGCRLLTTAPALPATILADSCYGSMFKGCSWLSTVPQRLPATTLADSCYASMFDGCIKLETAPELPATTLTHNCYASMFGECTSLTTAPELPATTLADSCYEGMFNSCTSLTTAPALPATTLAHSCYFDMFFKCTSLTTPPALPATTLADRCYANMFRSCSSLIAAPELPATTLTEGCYNGMFMSCSSLRYIKCLATNISARGCTGSWVFNVPTTTEATFVKNPSIDEQTWGRGENGIPVNWAVRDAE